MNSKWFRWFFVSSIAIGALLVSIGFAEIQSQANILHHLVVQNQRLVVQAAETAYKSAETRITTVSQRCDLTHKITEVLGKDDPRRVHVFQVSYRGCLAQLKEVKHIATQAKLSAHGEGL
jgi:hypothetical protein